MCIVLPIAGCHKGLLSTVAILVTNAIVKITNAFVFSSESGLLQSLSAGACP